MLFIFNFASEAHVSDQPQVPIDSVIRYPDTNSLWVELDEQDTTPGYDGMQDLRNTASLIELHTNTLLLSHNTDMSMIKRQLADIARTQEQMNQRIDTLTSSVDELGRLLAAMTDQLKYMRFDTTTTRRHLLPNSGL